MAVETELIYSLVSPDGSQVFAEAPTLDGILLAAATLRSEYEYGEFVVFRGGAYDPSATLLAQEGLAV